MSTPQTSKKVSDSVAKVLPHAIKHRIKKYRDLLLRKPQDLSLHAFSHSEHALNTADPLSVEFHQRGPWFTEFEYEGKLYGGTNSYNGCRRILDFCEWAQPYGRVVELGSFEGMHSLMLAAHPQITSVLGLEARQYLIDKAAFIKTLYGLDKVEFRQCDLEVEKLAKFGQFDFVFCSGLLYHMTHPWDCIRAMTQVSDRIFVGSHIADVGVEEREGFQGKTCPEYGYHEPLSGTNTYSFWLTHEALVEIFRREGFELQQSRIVPEWPNGTWENAFFVRTATR